MEKACKQCGNTFEGRADKQFCSDRCRYISYNKKSQTQLQRLQNMPESYEVQEQAGVKISMPGATWQNILMQDYRAKITEQGATIERLKDQKEELTKTVNKLEREIAIKEKDYEIQNLHKSMEEKDSKGGLGAVFENPDTLGKIVETLPMLIGAFKGATQTAAAPANGMPSLEGVDLATQQEVRAFITYYPTMPRERQIKLFKVIQKVSKSQDQDSVLDTLISSTNGEFTGDAAGF